MTCQASYPLPRPMSVNNAFANVAGKGRVKSSRYQTWRQAAGWELKSQGPIIKVPGKVVIDLIVPRTRMDLDNTFKPYLDLLVDLGAIDDDRHVEGINAWWTDAPVGRVVIRSAA